MVHQNRGKHKNEASLEELIRENSVKKRVSPDVQNGQRNMPGWDRGDIRKEKWGKPENRCWDFRAAGLPEPWTEACPLGCLSSAAALRWPEQSGGRRGTRGLSQRLLSDSAWGGHCETCSTLELNAVYRHVLSLVSLTLLMSSVGWSTYDRL